MVKKANIEVEYDTKESPSFPQDGVLDNLVDAYKKLLMKTDGLVVTCLPKIKQGE